MPSILYYRASQVVLGSTLASLSGFRNCHSFQGPLTRSIGSWKGPHPPSTSAPLVQQRIAHSVKVRSKAGIEDALYNSLLKLSPVWYGLGGAWWSEGETRLGGGTWRGDGVTSQELGNHTWSLKQELFSYCPCPIFTSWAAADPNTGSCQFTGLVWQADGKSNCLV